MYSFNWELWICLALFAVMICIIGATKSVNCSSRRQTSSHHRDTEPLSSEWHYASLTSQQHTNLTVVACEYGCFTIGLSEYTNPGMELLSSMPDQDLLRLAEFLVALGIRKLPSTSGFYFEDQEYQVLPIEDEENIWMCACRDAHEQFGNTLIRCEPLHTLPLQK